MVSIVISWIVIGIYSYLYGRLGISFLYKRKVSVLHSMDVYVVFGILIINVYAQFFSIFYKIAGLSFLILSIGAVGCFICLLKRNEIGQVKCVKSYFLNLWRSLGKTKLQIALLLCVILGTLLWTNMTPQHYDTYLYHAQAIHWIEEYSVVPGLGNLHFRLAYNSAFMTLQALFSFAWLTGSSLHTMNGFVAVFLLLYLLLTFQRENCGRIQISDILKLSIVAYLVYNSFHISSPNTDTWALLLICYICVKWSEFVEKQVTEPLPYAFLCLLCVYAVTLKLSVAIFVILTIYPAVLLIRMKQWKEIAAHILIGIITVVPYFVRNVIISGYLVYPYPEFDFFRVDWKMPAETLFADRNEIIAWGRGNMDVSRNGESLIQWVPDWYMSIHLLWRVLLIIAIVAGVVLLGKGCIDLLRRRNLNGVILNFTVVAGMIFWFLSAPLPRYGIIFMLLLPSILLGICLESGIGIDRQIGKVKQLINEKIGYCVLIMMLLFYTALYFPYSYIKECNGQPLILQNDYHNRETAQYSLEGYEFAAPVERDQTGYEPFPALPYPGVLTTLELRGDSLQSGFRVKE